MITKCWRGAHDVIVVKSVSMFSNACDISMFAIVNENEKKKEKERAREMKKKR